MISDKIFVETIVEGIQEKKGKEITVVDLSELSHAFCDFFIICHGDSGTQVNAIADSIEEKVKKNHEIRARSLEGIQNAQWVLMDFQNIIVHIFQKEYRDHYKLEELWGDARITVIEE